MELSPLGIRQAQDLRDRLAGERLDAIYTSHLKRAHHTAQIINSAHGLPLAVAPELGEIDFGELEGLTFEEVRERYPQAKQLSLSASLGMAFPGGDDVNGFARRVMGFLSRLGDHPNGRLLVVAHSGSLRVIICHLLGLERAQWWRIRLDLGSLSQIELHPEGAILLCLNDTCHLRE